MMTVSTTERAFPVKFIKKGVDEEVILSYAIGPLIKGKRAPSILRMKLKPGHVLQIENLSKGVWIPIAHARYNPSRPVQCGVFAGGRHHSWCRDPRAAQLSW